MNTQIGNAVMSLHKLIEYTDKYSERSGSLRQYYRDEPALTDASAIGKFSW